MKLTTLLAAFCGLLSPSFNMVEKHVRVLRFQDTLKVAGADPVCKMKLKAGTTPAYTLNKVTYGFCSQLCLKKFKAKPDKFIKK